ncbi:MAG: M13 family metallopeptidase [Myxococcota bacterium]|nr:M13 family metallopeptidase [Deltaproteobacteria bacterium]MDQ3337751.1 M13 family metallopeptidase [Myxococcota bacterium]
MKKFLAIALFAAACGSKSAPPTTTTQPDDQTAQTTTPDPTTTTTPATTPPAPPPPTNRPELGTWGFDSAGMNKEVTPGESFYQFANGTYLKTTQIPADKSNYGMFGALDDRSQERTKLIIQSTKGASGTEAGKIADYYKSFMDEAAIEAKGWEPIKPELEKIAAIKDRRGLVARFAEHSRSGRKSPLATYVAQDEKDPERHIALLVQSGLGLPDRDMYDAKKGKQFATVRDGYKKYIAAMLTLIGTPDAEKRAAAIYALEEKIALTHWTKVQNRDPVKSYNKLSLAQLAKLAPGVDWKTWLEGTGLAQVTHINVNQPSAIAGISKLVASQPVDVWKDYLTLQLLTATAPYLPKAFVDARFEMYGKVLSGTPQNKERWKRAVDEVEGAMGEAVGKIYVAQHFPPATKAKADELVKNLLVAMGQRIDALAWMSAETKAKAKIKLSTYNPKIGYPTKWRDYSALEVKAGDVIGNDMRASAFQYNHMLAKLGKTVDRDEWLITPMTVNAYYQPTLNEIVFPAAILQPPFFDANADAAVNYGGIGGVIGHEISHGFDDQGAQYDEKGALKNWWSKADLAKFNKVKKQLIAQYDAYCPFPAKDGKAAQCVKGELTLGENIADLAGLTIAYQAYQISLGGKPAPVIDGLTGDQRFFLGWAQVWRRLYRDQELANRLVTDPHAPSEYRTSVVRNLDSWYDAYKPTEKEALFLAPDKRVRIW